MKVALYARVSTPDQDPEPQLVRLRQWASSLGHEVKMERAEVASGRLVRRPMQEEILGEALGRRVDAVAVVKVDRWARSIKHLATTVEALHERGAAFYATDQGIEFHKGNSTTGLALNILGAVAAWEADIISERTREGLAARRARGIVGGRRAGFKRCGEWGCQRMLGHKGNHGVKGIPVRYAPGVPDPTRTVDARLPDPERNPEVAKSPGSMKGVQVPREAGA